MVRFARFDLRDMHRTCVFWAFNSQENLDDRVPSLGLASAQKTVRVYFLRVSDLFKRLALLIDPPQVQTYIQTNLYFVAPLQSSCGKCSSQ
jgi:hypothetical protein